MVYCRNCGAKLDEKAVICPSCGVPQQSSTEGSPLGYGILGCCVPVVGLVLFLVWKDNKPKTAKAAGIGALISVVLYYVFWVFIGFIYGIAMFY